MKRVFSEDHRRKLSEAQRGHLNHNYGKTLSKKQREQISDTLKGRKHSAETRKKMRESQQRRRARERSNEG